MRLWVAELIRIPVAETRAVAKALDGEHDTVEDAAEAAIRALDVVRDERGMWASVIMAIIGGRQEFVPLGRGPWPSKSIATKDAVALASSGPSTWPFRVVRLRRESDGYRQG